MTNYWLYRAAGGPVEGPFTADQLKQMAVEGRLHPHEMVADDRGEWVEARRVPALFPRAVDWSSQVQPPPESAYALQPAAHREPAATAPGMIQPPPAVGPHHALHPEARGTPGKPRNLTWLLVLSIVHSSFWLVQFVVAIIEEINNPGSTNPFAFQPNTAPTPSDLLGCFGLIFYFGIWMCWAIWLYMAYDEYTRYSPDDELPSPGLALGLSFIPVFNLFWQIYAPFRLTLSIERHLAGSAAIETGRREAPSAVILTVLLLSVVPGCCLAGMFRPLLLTIGAFLIQRNLNILWKRAAGGAPNHVTHGYGYG